jgi:predicted DCC family thiol-disulfide oxidoreductase YuxK
VRGDEHGAGETTDDLFDPFDLFNEARLLLVFDGWCGVCTRTVDWVHACDRRARVRSLPSQTPGLIERLGLTREQVNATVWAIDRAGRRFSEADAVNLALYALGGRWRLLARLFHVPGIHALEGRCYRWFAPRRRRFGFLGATPACERPGARCTPYGA